MNKAYLLLGSNEGNREEWLSKALAELEKYAGRILLRSQLYKTAAWGLEDQPDFLNMAVCLETELQPLELLQKIQDTELLLGRQREVKWGQRTLDIDILFYNDDVITKPELNIPHPYMQERRFVLVPLHEIAPKLLHPLLRKNIEQLLSDCKDPLEVILHK